MESKERKVEIVGKTESGEDIHFTPGKFHEAFYAQEKKK